MGDATCTLIAWTPFLALAVAFLLWMAVGVAHLEARTWGSQFVIPNAGSVDAFQLSLDRKEEMQQAEAQAQAELDALERQQQQIAAQQYG